MAGTNGRWLRTAYWVIGFYPLILTGLVLDYSYTTHTYTGKVEGYLNISRSQDNWLGVGEWDWYCSLIMMLHRRKAGSFSAENAGLFTLAKSGIKVLDTVCKHNVRKNVNTRCCGTIACLFHFHILIQGMVISSWHFNFRCFYNSVLWIWILSVHVYALVGDHDRTAIGRVIQQKYCRYH